MLHSVKINFNGFQIFDAYMHYTFYPRTYLAFSTLFIDNKEN